MICWAPTYELFTLSFMLTDQVAVKEDEECFFWRERGKKKSKTQSHFFPCCYRFGLLCSVIFVVSCYDFTSNIKYRTQGNCCAYEIMELILILCERHRHAWSLARRPGAGWRQSCTPANLLTSLSAWEGSRGLLLLPAEKRGNKSGREIPRRAMRTSVHNEGWGKLAEVLPPLKGLVFFPSFLLIGHPEGRRWFMLGCYSWAFLFFWWRDVSSHDSNWAKQGNLLDLLRKRSITISPLCSYKTFQY